MDVRIGVTQHPKEIEIDLGDDADSEAIQKEVAEKIASESGVLWFTDRRGRVVGIPAHKIAYVEIGSDTSERRVGFIH